MADIRINGKRIPPLKTVDNLGVLIQKLEIIADKNKNILTSLKLNNKSIDIDNFEYYKLKIEEEDKIEAKLDTPAQLSFESLQVAMDMAELLLQDLKTAAIHIWDENKSYTTSLDILLKDCQLFLTLAAKPVYLLEQNPDFLDGDIRKALEELDKISNYVETSTYLSVLNNRKDACFVLVGYVKTSLERWIGLCSVFAKFLNIDTIQSSEEVLQY